MNDESKLRRKECRTKKALSVSMLLYFSLKEGAMIKFHRSRVSHYALKVLRGSTVKINETYFDNDRFNTYSEIFIQIMRKIVENSKKENYQKIMITHELFQIYEQTIPFPYEIPQREKVEMDSRNKEAIFSNFLSSFLIQRGYQMHFSMKKRKESVKELPLFVWKGIISPDGKYYQIQENTVFVELIEMINQKMEQSKDIEISFYSLKELKNQLKCSSDVEMTKDFEHSQKLIEECTNYCHQKKNIHSNHLGQFNQFDKSNQFKEIHYSTNQNNSSAFYPIYDMSCFVIGIPNHSHIKNYHPFVD